MFKISLFLSTLILIPFITPIAYCGWESQQPIPYDVYVGGALCKDPYFTHLYAICGNGTNKFYTYNYNSPYWDEMTSTVPEGVIFDDGACMTAIGGEQGKFLLFASNENTECDEAYLFHKFFVIRGRWHATIILENIWQQFSGPPFDVLDAGSALASAIRWSTPVNITDIYTLEGYGQGFFRTSFWFPENLGDGEIIDIYPPEDAVISISQPTFDWKDVEPCDGYQLQISSDSLFQHPLVDTFITEGEFKNQSLSDDEYFWRFRIKIKGTFVDWITPIRFFVNTSLPIPHEDAFITTPYPYFDWEDTPSTEYYYFQLDDDADFSSPIVDTTTEYSDFKLSSKLAEGIYYWREKGDSSSTWSEGLEFQVYTASFGVNSFVPSGNNAFLDWSPVEGAVEYWVQMANDSLYSEVILDEITEASVTVLSEPLAKEVCIGTHWWRFCYRDDSNDWSDWIEQNQARIWEPLLDYPQITGEGGSLTYAWDNSRGAAFIYGLSGGDEPDSNFYKYPLNSPEWIKCDGFFYVDEDDDTIGPGYGASLAWDWGTSKDSGRYIYATLGNDTRNFQRYNLWRDDWSDDAVAELPGEVGDDSEGRALSYVHYVYNNDTFNYIYCLIGGYTNLFYRYEISDKSGEMVNSGGGMSLAKPKISETSLKASPIPFTNRITVFYSIKGENIIGLKIYDVKGGVVKILEQGTKNPGVYETSWNGIDEKGKRVKSGIYFLELTTETQRLKRKLILR